MRGQETHILLIKKYSSSDIVFQVLNLVTLAATYLHDCYGW